MNETRRPLARRSHRTGQGVACHLLFVIVLLVSGMGATGAVGTASARVLGVPMSGVGADSHVGPGFGGFALAGDRVVWVVRRGHGYDAFVAGEQGAPVRVGRLALPAKAYSVRPRVTASSSVAVIQASYEFCGNPSNCRDSSRAWIGAVLALPSTPAAAACGVGSACSTCASTQPLAVSGSAVATNTGVCDLLTGTVSPLPAGATALALAGDLAAVIVRDTEGSQLVVLNWRSGTELYRVQGLGNGFSDFTGFLPEGVTTVDVQDDGTAVFPLAGMQAWASPAAPTAHPFTVAGAEVRIAGGLVALERSRTNQPTEVEILGLDGGRRLLTPRGLARDFDGTQLAVARKPCFQVLISVEDFRSAATAGLPRTPCPIQRVIAGPRRVLTGRRLSLALGCSDRSGLGCLSAFEVLLEARTRHGGRAVRLVQSRALGSDPGQVSRVAFHLSRAALRFVRCRRSVRVIVQLRGYPNSDEPPPIATPRARKSFKLRPHRRVRC